MTDITEYIDQDYAGNGRQSQKLYLAIPAGASAGHPVPVVIYIHGGGWIGGTFAPGSTGLATGRDDTNAFLEAGYAVAVINYRLSTEARWPAQIHDCKAAVRFLRAHAGKYGIDPDRIVAWGASAGAHLAQFLGFTNGDARYDDPASAASGVSSTVNLVIAAFGISDISRWVLPGPRYDEVEDYKTKLLGTGYTQEAAHDASPIDHVHAGMAPMLLAHADDDALVPCDQTHWLEAAIHEVGGGASIETWYPHTGGHGDPRVWRAPEATDRFIDFCDRHLR
ncbi:lipase [Bifidobacterium ramosum]|nr:alpha/beta hydrolase [Bifidobacterium ramosum]KAB8287329.1 lipase [Bifidobacterium ramosum]